MGDTPADEKGSLSEDLAKCLTTFGNGSEWEYKLKDGGLVVIIEQVIHNFTFRVDWSTRNQLNYDPDVKRLEKLFEKNKDKITVWKKKNLTEGSFGQFMLEVCSWRRNPPVAPNFIMFFLMSHGFQNGEFLLATSNDRDNTEGHCCGAMSYTNAHTLEGNCHGRHIVKDVVEPINESYPGIPKVFVVQACRGYKSDVVKKGAADPPVESNCDHEMFIPEMSDTLVFRACMEENVSWVLREQQCNTDLPNGGSLFIQMFCKSWEELLSNQREYEKLMRMVPEELSKLAKCLRECRENALGGWLMNVCQRTTSLVSNYLVPRSQPDTELVTMLQMEQQTLNCRMENEKFYQKFVSSLEILKSNSLFQTSVDALIELLNNRTTEDEKQKVAQDMIVYLYDKTHVNEDEPPPSFDCSHLDVQETNGAVEALNQVLHEIGKQLKEIRKQEEKIPYDKQQPHISSNLSKKFSCIKLLAN